MTIQLDPPVAIFLIIILAGLRRKDIRRLVRRSRLLTELIHVLRG